jgi:hypothetical protein
LASVEQLVAWMTANREKIFRYGWILQVFAGLVLLVLGYLTGHDHFHLIRQGVRAPGTIIGYKQTRIGTRGEIGTLAYMPVVEFHTNDRFVQFQDWLGTNIAGSANVPVIVLYDPADSSVAMIDRPVWNWIPWAPVFALGVFLLLVAIKGFFQSRRSAEIS